MSNEGDDAPATTDAEQRLETEIGKEIAKLQFYLEETDELIESQDFEEMATTENRVKKIGGNLQELISRMQELKIEQGHTPRGVRQWKKDTKAKYSQWTSEKDKLSHALKVMRQSTSDEAEQQSWEEKRGREERLIWERHQKEKEMWEEKMEAELKLTERKLEMERASKATQAKLPKLKITPFKGTPADWVRFENMFATQVDNKPISDEEKYGYLLELVAPKIRERISNLRPGTQGYKTAWGRLQKEYGQTKLVVNAHMEEIINLPVVKGSHYEKILEFYESLSKNYDALQTLGESDSLKGFVMSTLNKLPQVKPDLVRSDDDWEEWTMDRLIDALQKWLRRNKVGETSKGRWESPRKEKHWYTPGGDERQGQREKRSKICIFCDGNHWGDSCTTVDTPEKRKRFFVENKLCFNCGRGGHRGSNCRGRGCFKCKARHHTSLCDKGQNQQHGTVLTGYTTPEEERSLPAIVPVKVEGVTLWAYLDTGSGRNFISSEAIKQLRLSPVRHETRNLVTMNGTKTQSMPIFDIRMESLDGKTCEEVQITGAKLPDFTTFRRPDMNEFKLKFEHTRDKRFYMKVDGEYPIHLILGDATYCKIRTEEVFKGAPEEPIVEGTTFGWIIHGGTLSNDKCMYVRESSDYEKLYSLDVLGVEDREENSQLDVHSEFKENVARTPEGRYEVNVPWIPGSELTETNEVQSRTRLFGVERKLRHCEEIRREYTKIIKDQCEQGIIEKVPEQPTGERIFYLPHKPVVRKSALTTKVRMVFDASAKPHPLASSVNECMYTGPPLQPLLWDIMIRARMTPDLLLGDIEKAFLQIAIKEEDRDAFRFLFNINGKEEHFRFARVPFGAEASPFILGATLQYHYDQQPTEFEETVQDLRNNTYVDNLMKTGNEVEELQKFKREATNILKSAKFPVHKWESNVTELESEGMPNPGKILGHTWDKEEDTLEINIQKPAEEKPATKKTILSQLGSIYDPLGILSPTMAEGKRIYREACDEKKGWNAEVSAPLAKEWLRWTKQLRSVTFPRSIIRERSAVRAIHIHQFADASNLACSTVTIAVVEHETGTVKGILTSKSRISKRNTSIARLELVSGQMAANMAKNVCRALKGRPIASVTVWMDSMVALYWISNPGKPWKVFVANRVRKIAESTAELGIKWRYCPTGKNLADMGSRGASIDKMEKGSSFTGPVWLLSQEDWPEQPNFKVRPGLSNPEASMEKPGKEAMLYEREDKANEWDELLLRKPYWNTLRTTAWAIRFTHNCLAKIRKQKKRTGPLCTDEILQAREYWVRREQKSVPESLEKPGWKLTKDVGDKGILKCTGRIQGYRPTFLEDGPFVQKLIRHTHEQIRHLGIASTMAALREDWWIPRLRSLVKREIKQCNVCKVFAAKPYGVTETAPLPRFRTEVSRPFQVTGVDFAGPLKYAANKRETGKASILVFTCSTTRAIHLEVTKSQTADEFQKKLNGFITRKTRPQRLISDNAAVFKTTATWIKKIRKSEKLQNFLAKQEITWQFNLSRSPWWGGMYERMIRDVKKTLYKTLGRTHLTFDQLEIVIMDIERHLNNRPLTYVEADGEEQVLTPNMIMWGQNAHIIEELEEDDDELTKLHRRLNKARQHAWSRWQSEYIHSLMEAHRVNRNKPPLPEVGEIVLLVGEGKNRGEWKKGKVLRHITGKDGVVRGVVLLHNGNRIERPLQLVCPLEIRSQVEETREAPAAVGTTENREGRRDAAKKAADKIRMQAADED